MDARTGKVVSGEYANWTTHPHNPNRVDAAGAPAPALDSAAAVAA